jgi:hypothetical protein
MVNACDCIGWRVDVALSKSSEVSEMHQSYMTKRIEMGKKDMFLRVAADNPASSTKLFHGFAK